MKPIFYRLLPIVLMILMLTSPGISQTFEGVIVYEIPELQAQTGSDELKYMLKDHRIRLEYDAGGAQNTAIIFNTIQKNMFIIFGMFDGYVEIPRDEFEEDYQQTELSFEETGRTKTIDGHECEIWETTLNESIHEYCLVPEMGNFIIPTNSMTIDNIPDWALVELPDRYMPLQVEIVTSEKDRHILMQALSIESRTLEEELFTVDGL